MQTRSVWTLAILTAFGALALLGRPAQAQTTFITAPSTASTGGSSAFDVTLTDTSLSSYQVGGFAFELSVPANSGIIFTDADMSTAATYIFHGNSFDAQNGLPLSVDMNGNSPFPTQDFIASDVSGDPSGYMTLNTGDMFGLGHISYVVAPGTPAGPVAVTFEDIGGGTSLSDVNGNAIPVFAIDGTITVSPEVSAAPEPTQWAILCMVGLGLSCLLLFARRRAI